MNHHQDTFTDYKNNTIYYQSWLPKGEIKALIMVVHGLGEHSGRYANLVNHLVPLGYGIYSWDHIGHGRSDGMRKYIDRFPDFTNVVSQYYHQIKTAHPALPIFILGHSMGGLITANYLLDHQADFKGAIFSAPAIKVAGGVNPFRLFGGRLLSVIYPKYGMAPLNPESITRDLKVLEENLKDPLNSRGKTAVRLLTEMLDAMARFKKEAKIITLPILVLQGSDDQVVDPAGADLLYELVSSEDKTLKTYPGLYHEVFHEPEREMVLADVGKWLERVSGEVKSTE